MSRITIHVAHSQWAPERKATLERLMSQLEPQKARVTVHRSVQREHASVWATRMYAAAVAEDAEVTLFLNDDVEVSPDLVAAIDAQTAQSTSEIVSLHATHPIAPSLAEAGQRWFSTWHVTGPAYYFRRGTAKRALAYYKAAPKAWSGTFHEDNILINYCWRRMDPIWNSLPSLVTHDTTVPSSLGFDKHPGRCTEVQWSKPEFAGLDITKPDFWKSVGEVPFLDTSWTTTPTLMTTEIANMLGCGPEMCWFCLKVPFALGSVESGARICLQCHFNLLANVYKNAGQAIARAQAGGGQ